MRRSSWTASGILLPLAWAPVAVAQLDLGRDSSGEELVSVRALADVERIGPGQAFHLAVVFDIEPKWHIYWKNPGEGAMPPRVRIDAPDGFRVGSPLWPRPVAERTPIGLDYCYFDQAVLFVPVTAPDTLAGGSVTFALDVDWAVCRDVCKLGSARRGVVIEAAAEPQAPRGEPDPLLAAFRNRLPAPLKEAGGGSCLFDGRTLTLSGPAGAAGTAAFFPDPSPGVTFGEPQVEITGGRFRVRVPVELNPANALGQPMTLGGLVALGDGPDDRCYDFLLPASATRTAR